MSIFAALAFASGIAAAKGPQLPAPDPERGSLAISIEATPPVGFGRMPAVQVYLVNLDRDADPFNADSVMQSNYSDGDQVYFLNAKPGRYVAVAARLRGAPMTAGWEYHAFLSRDTISQTETTVVAGRIAFMGQFSLKTSTKMEDADPAQAHYYRVISPETARKGFMSRAFSGAAPYTAQLTKAARDALVADAFWKIAERDSFKGEPSWQNLVRLELESPKNPSEQASASNASAVTTMVTLNDGKTYEVATVRGLPSRFANDQISVIDLGITARFAPDHADAPPYVRLLVADLIAAGQFAVTITTPLDSSASATLEATGPGKITLQFFPQADYPRVWEGIDQPGVHWFPFHFVFEEKQAKQRFEFTQWAQLDDRTWKEVQDLTEQGKQAILEKQQ